MRVISTNTQGLRLNMEDEILISESEKYKFFCIFDGHGGDQVAKLCQQNFVPLFMHELKQTSSIERAFKNVYSILDQKAVIGGATAVTAVLNDRKLWVANCGDSEAFGLTRTGYVIPLTQRHKVIDELERLAGICQITKSTLDPSLRINGTLNIARAIGDAGQPAVISTPVVNKFDILDFTYLIFASDGLWDVFGMHELGNFIKQGQEKNARDLAHQIITQALYRGSTDNISIILLQL